MRKTLLGCERHLILHWPGFVVRDKLFCKGDHQASLKHKAVPTVAVTVSLAFSCFSLFSSLQMLQILSASRE